MKALLDPLEHRRLLAGVTLLAHGYNGNIDGWVQTAAEDIADRAGGGNAASIYTMTVGNSGGLAVTSFTPDSGQKDYRQTTSGEVIIKLDWSAVDDGSVSTNAVAAAVDEYFRTAHGGVPPLAELPMHFIGHSRGASLITALSRDLGEAGIRVDQITSLDPHPVDGENDLFGISFGDAKMTTYDNVDFADNYWRTDGNANNTDFDGEPVPGAHQGDLNGSVQQNFFVSAHGAVPAYYIGTIDTDTSDGGDHPVNDAWYGDNAAKPPREGTGFLYSRLGGGTRPSDGLYALVGGAAQRDATAVAGSQWANGFNVASLAGTTVSRGTPLRTRLAIQDRDSGMRVNLYLDANQNPYDGAAYQTSKRFSSTALNNGRIDMPTEIGPGSYYILAKTTDTSGHARWAYSASKVTIEQPTFGQISAGTLFVNGTDNADKIRLTQSDTAFTATLNGASLTFASSDVQGIQIQAGTGNDSVDASGTKMAIYVNGGPGFDNIVGGDGNDTLSGGAQSNTLTGGLGDDVLNGSGGNDLLVGNGGYDRLYSNGGQDTLNGGSNVDRLFGHDAGNELMIGGNGNDKIYAYGGNDTLIGGADSDILDGGDGEDTSDTDANDILISIEKQQ